MALILGPKEQALYEVLSLIGEGGLGSVYRVRLVSTGVEAAVKLLHSTHREKEIHDRFLEEVRRIGGVQGHPNIVSVYDAGKDNLGSAHVAMELVNGPSLAAHLEMHGPVRPRDVPGLALGILDGLREAHDDRVLHRNLSPSNVLLRTEGGRQVPVLSDLGFARCAYTIRRSGEPYRFVTGSGRRFADPLYVAPECDVLERWDVASDLFSVGLLIHAMLTGKHPLGNENAYRAWLLDSAASQRSLPLDRAVPEEWQHFLMKALAVEPAHRFTSADEMKRGLAPLLEQEALPSRARKLLLSKASRKRVEPPAPAPVSPAPVKEEIDPDKTVLQVPGYDDTGNGGHPVEEEHPDPGPSAVTDVAPWAPQDRPERTAAMTPRPRRGPLILVIGVGSLAALLLFLALRLVFKVDREAKETAVSTGMAFYEGGQFILGGSGGEQDELPERVETIAPFFLDTREVTVGEYYERFRGDKDFWPKEWNQEPPTGDWSLPMTRVTWEQAAEYARRLGKRLPTALEWERAARAGGGIYPWGSAFSSVAGMRAVPADSVTKDRTPEGVLHLAGNVSEWTASPFRTASEESEDSRTVKGTSFDRFDERQARSSFQTGMPKDAADPRVGFRCALSPKES